MMESPLQERVRAFRAPNPPSAHRRKSLQFCQFGSLGIWKSLAAIRALIAIIFRLRSDFPIGKKNRPWGHKCKFHILKENTKLSDTAKERRLVMRSALAVKSQNTSQTELLRLTTQISGSQQCREIQPGATKRHLHHPGSPY